MQSETTEGSKPFADENIVASSNGREMDELHPQEVAAEKTLASIFRQLGNQHSHEPLSARSFTLTALRIHVIVGGAVVSRLNQILSNTPCRSRIESLSDPSSRSTLSIHLAMSKGKF
jgi:hypothetical protein